MPVVKVNDGRGSIPMIYVKGTHYQVGHEVGRAFGAIIHSFLEKHKDLNCVLIPLYNTDRGRDIYDATLCAMTTNYPQYVAELEGTAEGARVPFYKLFLLQMEDILPGAMGKLPSDVGGGCSSVMMKGGKDILAHNEDALSETLNHFYFVSAHVIPDDPNGKEERFTSLCYAGSLPGFTMSYNHYGFVFSVNVICVKTVRAGRTPRTFLTRALLTAHNIKEAEDIIKDAGFGVGNGVSLNMVFLNENQSNFYNAEVAPPQGQDDESIVDIVPVNDGECLYHCNKFNRLEVPERKSLSMESSICRHKVMDALQKPKSVTDIINVLGDESNPKYPIYRTGSYEPVATIATGIFDCSNRTWSIFADNPKNHGPLMVLPLDIKI